ncbi:MAG: hypothetical protein RSC80_00050 [Odoribacter sp.]
MRNIIFDLIIVLVIASCSTDESSSFCDCSSESYKNMVANAQIQSTGTLPNDLYLYVFKTDGTFVQEYKGSVPSISFALRYGDSYYLCFTLGSLTAFTNKQDYKLVSLSSSNDVAKKVNNVFPYLESSKINVFYSLFQQTTVNNGTNSLISNVELKRPEAQITIRKYVPQAGATKAYLRAPSSYGVYDMYGKYSGDIKAVIGEEVALTGGTSYEISVRLLPTLETSTAVKTFTLCVYYGSPRNQWVEYNFVASTEGVIQSGKNYVFNLVDNTLNFVTTINETWGTEGIINN